MTDVLKAYNRLHSAVVERQFVTCNIDLEPMNDCLPIMPPTYIDADQKPIHHYDNRIFDGEIAKSCVIDSIQSQARRMQLAIGDSYHNGKLKMPFAEIEIDLKSGKITLPITALPHKIGDSILLQSIYEKEKTTFANSTIGRNVFSSNKEIATKAILSNGPLSLIFGTWLSSKLGASKLCTQKIARCIISEIFGEVDSTCQKSQSRVDPLNPKGQGGIYLPKNGIPGDWKFEKDKNDKDAKQIKLSVIGMSSIPPTLSNLGVICKRIRHMFIFNLSRLDAYETKRPQDDNNVRTMLACLGICGHILGSQEYKLRSGCDLVRKNASKANTYSFMRNPQDTLELDADTALALYKHAVKLLPDGVEYDCEKNIMLKSPKQYNSLLEILDDEIEGDEQ